MSYLTETLAARLRLPEITVEMMLPVFDIVTDAAEDVGALVVVGREVHSCLKPGAITRRRLREIWRPLLARYGHLETKVPAAAVRERRFVERMGFELECEGAGVAHYLIEKEWLCRLRQ